MDNIHIIGDGGVAGIGMTRCLEDFFNVTGHDSSEWGTMVSECKGEIKPVSMIIPVPDKAVLHYSDHPKCYIPSTEEIILCQDKQKIAEVLAELAPTIFWGRDSHGAGGQGAQLIQEYLPGRNFSCELLYWDGTLIGMFQKERLAYDLQGSKVPTHQIGSSAVSRCIQDKGLAELSVEAVRRISSYFNKKPHGVYSVDFKENKDFELKVTEINAGRFLTASYSYYYMTGYNLPLLMAETFLNMKISKLGKYPLGQGVIRQVDSLPTLVEEL